MLYLIIGIFYMSYMYRHLRITMFYKDTAGHIVKALFYSFINGLIWPLSILNIIIMYFYDNRNS